MILNPRTTNETYVKQKYLEKIRHKREYPSGYKQKYHQDASNVRKKKWKGKYKKMEVTRHHCKDPNNHYNHCNINGHIEDK
jgi:hypothetical protein